MSQQPKISKHMKACVAKNVNKINNLNKNSTPAHTNFMERLTF